jgi:hypothetical protein
MEREYGTGSSFSILINKRLGFHGIFLAGLQRCNAVFVIGSRGKSDIIAPNDEFEKLSTSDFLSKGDG